MANFNTAFTRTLENEGGFILHKVKDDSGGWTYAGISENYWPNWEGWPLVKSGREEETTQMVKDFYRKNFWNRINGDQIKSEKIAYNIYDFAVNAGTKTSAKLAQRILGVSSDGLIGPISIKAINDIDEKDEETFEMKFALTKIARYAGIGNKNKTQTKFLLGWTNRTLKVLQS